MLKQFINVAYAPRFLNIGVALWLFVSVFVWPHDPAPTMVAAFASALVGTFAIMGMVNSKVRFGNTFMGVLIICEGLIVPHYLPMTHIHDAAIGVFIVAISLWPSPDMPGTEVDLGTSAGH